LELGSNSSVSSKGQDWKQYEEIVSTDAGMRIDLSDGQQLNALASIRIIFEFGSNMAVWREVHSSKHFWGRIATAAGIQIDVRAEQRQNAPTPI
jgi:hypothetical protein